MTLVDTAPRVQAAPIARPRGSEASARRRLARGSLFFFVIRVLGAALTYATQVLLARWMGKVELGHYVAAFSWCLVLGHVAILGLPSAALRFVPQGLAAGDVDLVRGFVRRSRQISLVAGLLLGLGGAAAAAMLGGSSPGTAAMIGGMLAIPFYSSIIQQSGLALGMSWQRCYTLPNNILRPLGLLGLAGAVWLSGRSLTALGMISLHVLVMALVAGGQAITLRRGLQQQLGPGPLRYETRRWLTTALPLMLVSIYGSYLLEYSLIFLDRLLEPGDLAVFGAAHRTAFLVGFALLAIDAASLPRLSHLYRSGDRTRLQAELRGTVRLRTLVAGLGLAGLIVGGRPLLGLFGHDFTGGYGATVILGTALFVRAATGPVAELLGLTGHHRVSFLVCAAGLVVTPLLNLLLVPALGLAGAALAVALVMTASGAWLHRQVSRRLGLTASILSWRSAA